MLLGADGSSQTNKFDLHERINNKWALLKSKLPILIGRRAERFFKKSFNDGGFTDKRFSAWKDRKKPDPSRAILVQSGRLKRSIRNTERTFERITVGSDTAYAPYHNFGTKNHPQRKFIGESEVLNKEIKAVIEREMKKIFK